MSKRRPDKRTLTSSLQGRRLEGGNQQRRSLRSARKILRDRRDFVRMFLRVGEEKTGF